MKKFIKNTLLCFGIVISIVTFYSCVFFNFIVPQYTNNFDASVVNKLQRLDKIEKPKIVLVGDSNVVFGFNSDEIEKSLDMPVVNMGLSADLGNAFLENIAKSNLRNGDYLVLCQYYYDDDDSILNYDSMWATIENRFYLWKYLRLKDIPGMIKALPNYMLHATICKINHSGDKFENAAYSVQAFNKFGDDIYSRTTNIYDINDAVIEAPHVSKTFISRINKLNQYCNDKGATLLIAGYPIPDGKNTPDKIEYLDFQNDLKSQVECKCISDLSDYFYDYSYFWDTEFHLTNSGAELRTKQFVLDFKRFKNSEPIQKFDSSK